MDNNSLNEDRLQLQNLMNQGNTVVGKFVKDGDTCRFKGIALNKWGEIYGTTIYMIGVGTLIYGGAKLSSKIADKIYNKIHQRRINKAKAQAFDEMVDLLQETKKELLKKYPHLEDDSKTEEESE